MIPEEFENVVPVVHLAIFAPDVVVRSGRRHSSCSPCPRPSGTPPSPAARPCVRPDQDRRSPWLRAPQAPAPRVAERAPACGMDFPPVSGGGRIATRARSPGAGARGQGCRSPAAHDTAAHSGHCVLRPGRAPRSRPPPPHSLVPQPTGPRCRLPVFNLQRPFVEHHERLRAGKLNQRRG